MAHPELESKERIIYKCCLNRVFFDSSRYNMIWCISRTYVNMSLRGKFPRPSRILWGVYIWTKSKTWYVHPTRNIVEIYIPAGRWHWAPGAHTDPSTFVALYFPFVSMYSFFIAALILIKWIFATMNATMILFWPDTLRHGVGGPKEKLNPSKMGKAIFLRCWVQVEKNTILII